MAKQNNKRRDLRIIWNSNAPNTNSGYAVFTRDLLFRLVKDGWPVSCVGFFGVEGYHTFMNGDDLIDNRFKGVKLKVYPKMADPYGGDALLNHGIDFKANVAMNMSDLWVLNPDFLQGINQNGMKFIPYLPIDQEPAPQGVLGNLRFAYKILTFTSFGQRVLENEGYTSKMIHEGIDTEIFKPMDKVKAREEMKLPQDAFIFGMIGANKENPPRKGYQEALEAFAMFLKNHEEGAMFFHSQQINPGAGFPIMEYAKHLKVAHRVFFIDQYSASFRSDSKQIAKEINTFDVQLHPSMTEGFGLLIVESQSCGIPVIVNNCHSMPELVIDGKTGAICDTTKPIWRSLNGYIYPADVNSLYNKMELVYKMIKDNPNKVKTDCRNNIKDKFNIDKQVVEHWIPLFENLQEEILGKVDTTPKK